MERITKFAPNAGFIAALLILLLVNGYAVMSLSAVIKSSQIIEQSVEAINEIELILKLLTDAETSQHAYIITGDETFLEPYRAAISPDGLALHLQTLDEMTSENVRQQERLARLQPFISNKLALTEHIIMLRQTQGFEAARALVVNNTNQQVMDNAREVIEEMDMAEDQLLRERTAMEDQRVQETIVALFTGVVLAAFISIMAVVLFNQEITRRQHAEQIAHQLNADLEKRVRERTAELQQANAELKAAELKYRTLVEQLPAAIYIDAVSTSNLEQYEVAYASPYFEILLGYTAQEMVDTPTLWASRLHPEDRDRVLAQSFHHYKTGEPLSHEYRMITRDGRTIWVEDETVKLPDNLPDVTLSQGVMFDITAIKNAQEALVQSEQRFRALIENSSEAISLLGADGRLTYVSPSTTRILGYSSEEAMGVDPSGWIHPDDLPTLMPLLLDLLQKPGGIVTAEYRFRHKDGSWRWVESSINNLLAEPSVGAIVFNYRDVTERKEHERMLATLVAVNAALRTVSTRAEMAPIILDQLSQVLNAAGTGLEIFIPETGELLIERATGVWTPAIGNIIPSDKGISVEVLATRQPYLNNDAINDPRLFRRDLFGNCRAIAAAPLIAEGKILGLLWLCSERSLSEHDLHLLTAIADTAANAMQRETLHENVVQQLQRLAALRDIDQAITSSVDLRMTLNVILTQTKRQLKADAVSILLMNKRLVALEYAAGLGFNTKSFEKANYIRLGDGYAGRAALERRSVHIENLQERQDNPRLAKALLGEKFMSYYAIPLLAKGQVRGVIEIFQRTPLNPDNDWISFFEALAGQTAIAIEGAQLFEGLQHSNDELSLAYDATIEGWSHALDLRDKETEGHTQRVTELTMRLAAAMAVNSEELVHFRRGALLHDMGKLGIPDSILLKPDKLTDAEWVIMKKHPDYAYEMLSPIEYLRHAINIPYCHHERWDGTGYPRGLKGPEIPLAARIFAVADVWEALRSDRLYRKAWSDSEARNHIRSESGKHFDPQVVDTFFRLGRR